MQIYSFSVMWHSIARKRGSCLTLFIRILSVLTVIRKRKSAEGDFDGCGMRPFSCPGKPEKEVAGDPDICGRYRFSVLSGSESFRRLPDIVSAYGPKKMQGFSRLHAGLFGITCRGFRDYMQRFLRLHAGLFEITCRGFLEGVWIFFGMPLDGAVSCACCLGGRMRMK